MGKELGVFVTGLSLAALCAAVVAEPLPKSGSISVHSGYWVVGEATTVADKHIQGHGSNRGVTFNDKGVGPLHLGPTDCFYTFSLSMTAPRTRAIAPLVTQTATAFSRTLAAPVRPTATSKACTKS